MCKNYVVTFCVRAALVVRLWTRQVPVNASCAGSKPGGPVKSNAGSLPPAPLQQTVEEKTPAWGWRATACGSAWPTTATPFQPTQLIGVDAMSAGTGWIMDYHDQHM